ncbi:hypothetical protein ACFL5V_05800 [Fibrobacterota bacterium]
MLNKMTVPFVIFLFTVMVCGCSSNFVVVDRMGMTFNLTRVKLEHGDFVEILDGEAIRIVPLQRIEKIVLDPSKTYYRDDKLYYHAVVELIDGTMIKPRKSGGKVTKSFVNIHNTVIGQGNSGEILIPLEDVNVLSQSKLE